MAGREQPLAAPIAAQSCDLDISMPPLPSLPSLSSLSPSEVSLLRGALNGFKRMVASSNVQKAIGTLLTAYFAIKAASPDVSPTFRGVLWTGFVGALFGLARECISATAKEDVAAKTPAPITVVQAPTSAPVPSPTDPNVRGPTVLQFQLAEGVPAAAPKSIETLAAISKAVKAVDPTVSHVSVQ